MRKLIHTNFELDLSPFQITDTEENSWFSDTFSSKISFPFTIDLEEDLDVAFGFISQYNTNPETLYSLKYQENNSIEDATFEIQEVTGPKVQAIYETGLDSFPSWDKKLSELDMLNIILPTGTTIYQYAKTMVNKVYPEVDFCWPAIHVNYYDNTDPLFENFKNIINNYQNGDFLKNTVNINDQIYLNLNIMQPAIFYLHILKRIVEIAGFELAGDILLDTQIQKKALFTTKDYFKKREEVVFDAVKSILEYNDVWEVHTTSFGQTFNKVNIEQEFVVTKKGRYLIIGNFSIYEAESPCGIQIEVNGTLQYLNYTATSYNMFDYQIDELVDIVVNVGDIIRVTYQSNYSPQVDFLVDYTAYDISFVLIAEVDANGENIPSIENENKVNLNNAVPDVTCGDFITHIKNWYNYDFDVVGKTVFMNKIESQINYQDAVSLEEYEVKIPTRKYQKAISFLLKFADIDSKEFVYDKVFQSAAGVTLLNPVINDQTKPIEINALPLPNVLKENITTAFAFEQNESKIYTVLYDGLQSGRNTTLDPTPMFLPQVHLNYWYKWFLFRINSVGYKWSFKALSVKLTIINIKKKIFAYNNYHIIKSFIKTEIKPGIIEVEIETESLK